jgi:hypothetical protein
MQTQSSYWDPSNYGDQSNNYTFTPQSTSRLAQTSTPLRMQNSYQPTPYQTTSETGNVAAARPGDGFQTTQSMSHQIPGGPYSQRHAQEAELSMPSGRTPYIRQCHQPFNQQDASFNSESSLGYQDGTGRQQQQQGVQANQNTSNLQQQSVQPYQNASGSQQLTTSNWSINSIGDANQKLLDMRVKINIRSDDWRNYTTTQAQKPLVQQLVDVFDRPVKQTPDGNRTLEAWQRWQKNAMDGVTRMKKKDKNLVVLASWLLLDAVLNVHSQGARPSSHGVDTTLPFTKRFRQVKEIVERYGIVRKAILGISPLEFETLAANPRHYLSRKLVNMKSNSKKGADNAELKALKAMDIWLVKTEQESERESVQTTEPETQENGQELFPGDFEVEDSSISSDNLQDKKRKAGRQLSRYRGDEKEGSPVPGSVAEIEFEYDSRQDSRYSPGFFLTEADQGDAGGSDGYNPDYFIQPMTNRTGLGIPHAPTSTTPGAPLSAAPTTSSSGRGPAPFSKRKTPSGFVGNFGDVYGDLNFFGENNWLGNENQSDRPGKRRKA